jgi:hypothetical protein
MLGKVSELYGLGKGESLEILEQGNNMVQGTAHLLSLTQEASISPGHMPGSGVQEWQSPSFSQLQLIWSGRQKGNNNITEEPGNRSSIISRYILPHILFLHCSGVMVDFG